MFVFCLVQVDSRVYKNMKEFASRKRADEDIFDRLSVGALLCIVRPVLPYSSCAYGSLFRSLRPPL